MFEVGMKVRVRNLEVAPQHVKMKAGMVGEVTWVGEPVIGFPAVHVVMEGGGFPFSFRPVELERVNG